MEPPPNSGNGFTLSGVAKGLLNAAAPWFERLRPPSAQRADFTTAQDATPCGRVTETAIDWSGHPDAITPWDSTTGHPVIDSSTRHVTARLDFGEDESPGAFLLFPATDSDSGGEESAAERGTTRKFAAVLQSGDSASLHRHFRGRVARRQSAGKRRLRSRHENLSDRCASQSSSRSDDAVAQQLPSQTIACYYPSLIGDTEHELHRFERMSAAHAAGIDAAVQRPSASARASMFGIDAICHESAGAPPHGAPLDAPTAHEDEAARRSDATFERFLSCPQPAGRRESLCSDTGASIALQVSAAFGVTSAANLDDDLDAFLSQT